MRIRELRISGYGIFNDTQIELPSSPFVLITGDNEAGKSTLFSFMRGVLAGFPGARQRGSKRYEPSSGGHGGAIVFETSQGVFLLERTASKNDVSIEAISGELSEINKIIEQIPERSDYEALYAYDLGELYSLHLLDKEELNERLFSASLSGASSLVSVAGKEIEESAKVLFRPRGECVLSSLYVKWQSLSEELNTKQQQLSEIQSKKNFVKDLENKVLLTESKLAEEELEYKKIDKELSALAEEKNYSIQIEKLQGLPPQPPHMAELKDEKLKKEACINSLIQEQSDLLSKKPASFEFLQKLYLDLEVLNGQFQSKVKNQKLILSGLVFALLIFFASVLLGSALILSGVFAVFCLVLIAKYVFGRSEVQIADQKLSQGLELIREELKKLDFRFEDSSFEATKHHVQEAIKKIKKNFASRDQKLEDIRKKIASNRDDILSILEEVSAENEEDYQLRLIQYAERSRIKAELSDQGVNEAAWNEKRTTALINEELVLKERALGEAKRNVNELRLQLQKIRAELLQNKAVIDHVGAEEKSFIESDIAHIKEQMQIKYSEWCTLLLTRAVFKKSLELLTQKQYADVLDRAGEFLCVVTAGRYRRIIFLGAKEGFFIETSFGKRVPLSHLSRGTVEQLYLVLRLCLSLHHSSKFLPLPILLDDLLVNFDLERSRLLLSVLSSIAREDQQIIMFSCHQWVSDLVAETVPNARQLNISTFSNALSVNS